MGKNKFGLVLTSGETKQKIQTNEDRAPIFKSRLRREQLHLIIENNKTNNCKGLGLRRAIPHAF
jgi:hypothetical protein